jgi:hypothetical protein
MTGFEISLKALQNQNWITLFIMSSTSFIFMSSAFTLGVILGGLIIIANFSVLQHTVLRAFSSDGAMQAKKVSIIAKYYLRLAVLVILIYILIKHKWVHPVGLTVGLSIVVFSIICLGIHIMWKIHSREEL